MLPVERRREGALGHSRVRPFPEITDGTSNTVLVAEMAGRPEWWVDGVRQPGVPNYYWGGWNWWYWVGPWAGWNSVWVKSYKDDCRTINAGTRGINCNNSDGLYAFHSGGANAAFADGSVRFLRESMPVGTLYSLLSRAGGEVVPGDAY
jgi:prepilin-type processing-associated H-X9-DG protein